MRPLNLKFTAFGPYPTTQTIDFTKLQNSNMFVISGPTGSGKTTIFDAISYALYGSASGSDRTLDMFRSDFAKMETTTEVEFEFAVKNQKYKITRTPAGERPKLRGEGMRKTDSSVKLEFGDNALTAQIEVANKIEEVIGLTKDQFKQIVLLPQGEFKKLLMSDSKSKEVIFRKIFDTGHIQKIQDKLRLESSELKRKIEDSELQIKTVLDAYPNITKTSHLTRLHTNTINNVHEIEAHLKSLNTELQENLELIAKEQQYLDYQLELKAIEAKLEQYQKNKELFAKYSYFIENLPVISNYKRITEELVLSHEKLAQNTEKQTGLQARQADVITKLEEFRVRHLQISKQYENLPQKRIQLEETQIQLQVINAQIENQQAINNYHTLIEKLTSSVSDLEQQKLIITESLAQLDLKQQVLDSNKLAIIAINEELSNLNKQAKIQSQINQLNTGITTYAKQLHDLNDKHQQEVQKLSEYRLSYIATQSGLLAAKLQPGSPCSVCGSLEHPSPATTSVSDITDVQITNQEQVTSVLNNQINTLMSKLEVDKALALQLTDDHQIQDINYNELIEKKSKELNELDAQNTKLSLQLNGKELHTKLEELNELLTTHNQDIVKYQYAADDLKSKLTLSNEQLSEKNQIEILIEDLKNDINQLTDMYELSNKSVQDSENELIINTKELEFLNLNIKNEQELLQNMKDSLEDIKQSLDKYLIETLIEMLGNQAEIKAEYNTYLTETVLLGDRKKTLDNLIKAYAPIDSIQINQAISKLNSEIEVVSSILEQFIADRYRQKSDIDSLKVIELKVDKLISKYQLIADISDIANGKTTSKISFERYMLAIYFKQIISRANIYFKSMTNNRFELDYKSPHGGIRAQGLDLNIIDNYTTKVRDVKSLSGGETFKAALAMALGLSDIVQMNSGGIQIDTIFIDEGFGSLDIDSLNSAIDTLISIESEGRIVGIISHVEELKNQVTNKIEVTTGPEGSTLCVNFS